MSNAITVSPNVVKTVPVSTTTKPVTVTAEVAVNRLCIHEIGCVVMPGSIRSEVPMNITPKKLKERISGGAA